jgi:hypothetical protein
MTWTRPQARAAALDRWASVPDTAAATSPARAAFLARFERQVDPEGLLPPDERRTRAARALRAHMIRLAESSAAKRRGGKR